MRFIDILLTPWRSSLDALRWLALASFAACCLGAVAVGVWVDKPNAWLVSMVVYCFGMAYLWAFWVSCTLLLSIDARHLRLPRVQRAVVCSLAIYAAMTVVAPAVVWGALGKPVVVVALLAALAGAAGLAFVLLPRYLALLLIVVPSMHVFIRHFVDIPGPTDPRFLAWGSVALSGLLLTNVLRWRQLLRASSSPTVGLKSAMVMQPRRQGRAAGWYGVAGMLTEPDKSGRDDSPGQRPNWMHPQADLCGVGPMAPTKAVRVALGGWYLPQTLGGYLRQMVPALLPLIIFVSIMLLLNINDPDAHAWRAVLEGIGIGAIGWIGLLGGVMLAAGTVLALRRRWRRTNAELPLLSLLPGLGDPRSRRRTLLRATLCLPLLGQALLLVLAFSAGLILQLGGVALLFVALGQLGCVAVTVVFALGILGGTDLSTWSSALLLIAACVLICTSTFLPLLGAGRLLWQLDGGPMLLLGAWAALTVGLLWLGRRGWHGLQQRPHPFLPN